MKTGHKEPRPEDFVAGNGLLHRRALLGGLAAGGLLQAIAPAVRAQAKAAPPPPTTTTTPWLYAPGAPMSGYGSPSPYEAKVQRSLNELYPNKAVAGPSDGWSGTPLEQLEGIITPSGLHHERHHAGVPAIDPAKHEVLLHGLVKKPLVFNMEALMRYPRVSRIQFLECSGNSYFMLKPEAMDATCGEIHGSVSCSEWTGVPARALLEEAGIDKKAKWVIAEGADASTSMRSIPLEKMLDDALIALFQNGEALRPEQGYPVRLFLPGFEGNMSIKWLRRLKLADGPAMAKDETSKYTDLLPDGKATQFSFRMGVKSVITRPSGKMMLPQKGVYEISGLAWSGAGRIKRVDVSADGGKTWAKAALYGQELTHSLVRFRLPWQWNGGPAILQSRATDEKGHVQETRQKHLARYSMSNMYHYNAINSWQIGADGRVVNVYV